MSTENVSKINYLMQSQPYGTVLLSSWLKDRGYSLDLLKRYKSSKWLESIGAGAMKRTGDRVEVEGAIFAFQNQLNLSIHVGGKSALAMLGRSHYLDLDEKEVTLFGQATEKLPKWFSDYEWASKLRYYRSNFITGKVGLTDFDSKNFSIKISGPVRAICECLYLAPKEQSLLECYELMEGMNNLRPATVQEILEFCNSVKVKRLFLFMAEKAGHSWLKHVKSDKIDLGTGKRSIVPNGVYISKYEITIPKELADYGSGV